MASPSRIWLRRWLLLLVGLLLAGVGLLVWKTEAIANRVIRQWLSTQELQRLELELEHLGLRSIRLRALAEDPGWRVRLDQMEVAFVLSTLWREQRIDEIRMDGLYVFADLNSELPIKLVAEIDLSGDTAENVPIKPVAPDLSWIAELPLNRVVLKNVNLELKQGDASVRFSIEAEAVRKTLQSLDLDFSATADSGRIQLSGTLLDGGESSFVFQINLVDIHADLDRWWPEWSEAMELPAGLSFAMGAFKTEGRFHLPADGQWLAQGQSSLSQLGITLEPGEVRMGGVELGWNTRYDHWTEATLQAVAFSGEWDEAHIPEQALQISFGSEDLSSWTFASTQALHWAYGDGLAAGATRVDGIFQLETPGKGLPSLSMNVHFDAFQAIDYAFVPFDLSLQGDLLRFDYELGPLHLQECDRSLFTSGKGELFLAETAEDPLRLSFVGDLTSDTLAHWVPDLGHASLGVSLNLSLGPEQTSLELDLTTPASPTQVSLDEMRAMVNQALVELRLQLDPEWTELRGTLSFESDGPTVSLDDLEVEGWGLFGNLVFDAVPMQLLLEEELDPASLLDLAGRQIFGQVEWMANRIEMADTLEANWLSGAFELAAPSETAMEPIDLSSSLSVGILRVLGESVDQIWVSARQQGDARRLFLTGDFSFGYAGSFASGVFGHTLQNPLGNPALDGAFELQPLSLDFIDAVGRHVTALESLSFSGELTAAGRYWLREGVMDASLESIFTDGSIDFPASQIKAEGVTVRKQLDSVFHQRGTLQVQLQRVEAGDIEVQQGEFDLLLNGMDRVTLKHGSLEAFGGQLRLDPMEVLLEPLNFEGGVRFERLSLHALTRQMSFFDGTMEGYVSGAMPFRMVDGEFIPEEGHLRLSEGEVARLHYNSKGLLSQPEISGPTSKLSFLERISERLMQRFRLQPEVVVEDALADLTITHLDIALFPADTPTTPVRIRFEGEAPAGPAIVPVRLQTNVHGTLDELYNFLIRLNSLGPATF